MKDIYLKLSGNKQVQSHRTLKVQNIFFVKQVKYFGVPFVIMFTWE